MGVGGVEGQLHTALGLLLEKQVVGEEVCTINTVRIFNFRMLLPIIMFHTLSIFRIPLFFVASIASV